MEIRECMKREVISLPHTATIGDAARAVIEHHIGTLPIVDEAGTPVGVTTIRAIIQIFLPDFVSLLADIDFVKDYGSLRTPSPGSLEKAESLSVADIMAAPVAVEDDCSLIRALSVMHKHHLRDLLVLKDGKLVGIASRVDIGRAFLVGWQTSRAGILEAA